MKGLELNAAFYKESVAPVMEADFPDVRYSAALVGWGSEILGFDDDLSTDHNWGLRFQLFLSGRDYEMYRHSIDRRLAEKLPEQFRGFPTAFDIFVNSDQRSEREIRLAKHNIDIETIEGFFNRYIGLNSFDEIAAADWLTFSEHKMLGVTGGKVFYDGLQTLEAIRKKLAYYPRDVWLYMLAAQWGKIFEEQSFVGRSGYAGDETGSALIAARQIKNLMRLCFIIERRYAPYSKWFGTAFGRLNSAEKLNPVFEKTLRAKNWNERQKSLAEAYDIVAGLHNDLKITLPVQEKTLSHSPSRPFLVFADESMVEKLKAIITSEEVKNIKHNLGSVNQFVDSNSVLTDVSLCRKLKQLYL